ncbi:hypothetical protein, partial [Paraburkholderia sp. RL17-373-BIF-A]|uniref:hypothetical protein n=1 Tax=Paraburkholderia sp. RL17-373-BIF-A TaxID=3031629 RepID=UPI0038BD34D9
RYIEVPRLLRHAVFGIGRGAPEDVFAKPGNVLSVRALPERFMRAAREPRTGLVSTQESFLQMFAQSQQT